MKTFGELLDHNGGIGPGFDFARIFLALSVLAWHSILISTGSYGALMDSAAWIQNYSILPMFFGLSGFLVAGSAQRNTLSTFAINRGFRIFPALIVEISLSAFLLGPLFTAFPLSQYFSDHQFFRYLLNMVALINYELPGVFLTNPTPGVVNGSLWTVPFEFLCYFVMAFVIVRGIINNGKALVATAVLLMVGVFAVQLLVPYLPESRIITTLLNQYVHGGKGPGLLPCFLLGAAAYVLRHKIPHDWRIFVACIAAMVAIGFIFEPSAWKNTGFVIIMAPIFIYVVCFVGLCKIPPIPYFHRGDYSYGVYLYGFPIQQALVSSSDLFRNNTPLLLIASFIVTTMFATFSWHVIEKPILAQRKRIFRPAVRPAI